MLQHHASFLDRLYDATLAPAGWTGVLETLTDMLSGESAWLSRLNVYDGTGSGLTTRLNPEYEKGYHTHYHKLNPYGRVDDPEEYLETWRPIVLTDADRYSRNALLCSEYYNDFMRPQDAHSVMFIRLVADGPNVSVININRSIKHDPFANADKEKVAGLQRHLIRAYRITRSLASAHAANGSLLEAMHNLPTPMFALTGGRISFANHAAERLLAEQADLKVVGGRLIAVDPPAQRRLEAQIGVAGSHDPAVRQGGTVSIPLGKGRALSLSFIPLRSEQSNVFSESPAVLVCVTDQAAPEKALTSPPTGTPLSGRERDCLSQIAQGKSDLEISVIMGVSHTTVISHVQNAKRKLGAKSRAQAVARCYAENLL